LSCASAGMAISSAAADTEFMKIFFMGFPLG
jgi:hypothetical protein